MNDLIPSQLGGGPLVDLGKAIGILDQSGNLDSSWFSHPADRVAALLTSPAAVDHERRQALLRALSQLFDQGASSLRDDTWSLALGDSGVDLLIRASPSDGGPHAEVEIGVGGRWLLHAHNPKLEVEAQFGILVVDTDSGTITPAEGIDASLVLSELTAGQSNVLDGIAIDAHLPFHDIDATTLKLRLVGVGPDDEDISFTLDTSPSWTDFEDPLLRLVVGALVVLADQLGGPAKTAVVNLLQLFGWKQDASVPGANYPTLELDALLANPGLALQGWLQTIWGDIDEPLNASNKVRLFLTRLLGMLRADTALTVEADGRYMVVRANVGGPLRFELLMWSEADAAGSERLHLGLRISARQDLGAGGPTLTFEAIADLLSFPLTGPISVDAIGEFSVDVRLSPRSGASHAISVAAAQLTGELAFLGSLQIGEVVAGLQLDMNGSFKPVLELRQLTIGSGSYPVLDLTNAGAVVEVAEQAAVGAVASAIRAALGSSEAGKRLAILAGIDKPAAHQDYPQLDFLALVHGPVDAYEVWMGKLIDDHAPARWFEVWLDTLRELLNLAGLGAPAIGGSGTAAAPWTLALAQGSAGSVGFEFAVSPDPTGGPRRTLAVELAASPAVLALGSVARFEAHARAGLLQLSVDNPKAADPKVDVTPVPGARVDAALIPPAGQSRISINLGVARLEAARLVTGVSWERGKDPLPAVDLVDPAIVLQAGAVRLDLGDLVAGLSLPPGSLPSLRLAGLSGLSGFGVGAFDGAGISLPNLSLPNFGDLNFSLPDLGLGSGGQWFVELGQFVLELFTVGLPSWALGGTAGAWRGWSLGLMQLLGGWPNFNLGDANGVAIPWPSGFDLDLPSFARFLRNPFDGLRLRLGQLFTISGGGPAGMALLWRWLRGQMPDVDGSLPIAGVPAIRGKGTYADPWAIQINDSQDFPVELISWVDPGGPPGVAGATTPSHVGFGLRLDLAPEPIVGPLELDLYARADLFLIDVRPLTGASAGPRPTPALALEAQMRHEDPSGWLLDQDSSAVRLRAVKLGLFWSPQTGPVPSFELVDAGYQPGIAGPASTSDLVGLVALSTGGVLLDRLAAPGGPLADNRMRPLMVVLESLGVAAANPGGGGGYHFLAVPMQRLLSEPLDYLHDRFWDSGTDLPKLRPLEPALAALGFTISPDANSWWAAAPLGDRILRLEESGTLHLTWGGAVPAGALELGLELTFNPFSGRTDGLFDMACGAADLRLELLWQDLDGYGGSPGSLSVRLVPTANSDMARAFAGPLTLWPAGDPVVLGNRVLTIGYRLAIEFAVAALFDALMLPHLSTAARGNLIAFGVLEGSVAAPHPAPLWLLFDDPVGRILERLRSLRGDFTIAGDFELHADEQRIALRTKNGAAINLGSGTSLALSLGVLTAPAANWAPELLTTFHYDLAGQLISVEAGYANNQPRLTVCGLQLLPSFAGFAGSGLTITGATLNALLPAAITGTLIGLDSVGGRASQIVSAIETLIGASSDTVSVKFNAVKTFVNELAGLIATPSLDFFTDARIRGLLAILEASLAGIAGVTSKRLAAAANDSAPAPTVDSNGTRLRVNLTGVPVAVVVGRSAAGQLGIWLVPNGSQGFGYVGIDEASKVGAYVSGSGTSVTPGAQCMLILTGSIPPPINLDPALRVDLDSGGATSLTLYFVGGSTESDTNDDLALQLLPTINFAMGDPMKLAQDKLLPLVIELAKLAGLTPAVLSQKVIGDITLEQVLIASGVLVAIAGGTAWAVSDPDGAMDLLGSSLSAIEDLVEGQTGLDIFFLEDAAGGKRFGVQLPKGLLELPNIIDDPQVTVVLGSDSERPRLPLLFVPTGAPKNTRFELGLGLRDIGLRVTGAGGRPLLSEGVSLGAVQATFDFDIGPGAWNASTIRYGFGLSVEGVGLPFGQASSGDPVAGSLMSDGGDNPGIDVVMSWANKAPDAGFNFNFPQATGGDGRSLELPLDMQFGPLALTALGVAAAAAGAAFESQHKPFNFTFDGSFGLGPLDITVDDFGLTIPLGTIADPGSWSVTLSGLAISFDQDPIKISGALLKQGSGANTQYVGTASVKVASFELAAIGAYSKLPDGDASLFIFAMIPVPLGGPPAFFVEGVAGGFGYNRGFTTPKIEQVASHPLMVVLRNQSSDLMATLRSVQEVLPAKRGAYWFAAGVKFSSFVFIKGAALLYVLFDQGFELGLLGHASVKLPDASAAVLSVGLVLSVGFTTRGNQGPMLWAEAQLTEDSWVLHSSIRLTGGFALRIWFRSGETVLSIGGYHPAFKPPEGYDYPVVPRVGLRWQVSSAITVKGECYFAITPREAMAGGSLEAVGKFGPVKAWFRAGVDILIGWDPFYYDLRLHIEIGFEVDLWLFTLRASVGVRLEVRGPELSGKAVIDLSLVSFTVRFGASSDPRKQPLTAKKFAETHLQLPVVTGSDSSPVAGRDADGNGPFDFSVTRGVVPGDAGTPAPTYNGRPIVSIDPEAEFALHTRMPFNVNADDSAWAGPRIDMLPSAKLAVHSVLDVTVRRDANNSSVDSLLEYEVESTPLPKAMFLGGADPGESDVEGRMRPAAGGESTTPMPDLLRILARAALLPASPPKISAYGYERAEYDHRLPFGTGGNWALVQQGQVQLQSAIAARGLAGLSKARQSNIAQLSSSVAPASYLNAIANPASAFADSVTKPPSRGGGKTPGGKGSFRWDWQPKLEAIGVVMPAQTRLARAAALTQTSVQNIRGAQPASRVRAPAVAERDHELLAVRLVSVRSRSATTATGAQGRSVYRGGRISEQAKGALQLLSEQVGGLDRRSPAGAHLAAGLVQVFDVPGDGVPPPQYGGRSMSLQVSGDQVGRLLFLGLGGRVIGDLEFGPGAASFQLPAGTKRVVAAGLGTPSAHRRVKASPVKPIQPIEPIKPVQPIQPIEPIKPVQPIQPIQPIEPIKPVQPIQPIQPVQPIQPIQPMQPQIDPGVIFVPQRPGVIMVPKQPAPAEAVPKQPAQTVPQASPKQPAQTVPQAMPKQPIQTVPQASPKQSLSPQQLKNMSRMGRLANLRGNPGVKLLGGNRFPEAEVANLKRPGQVMIDPNKAALIAELANKKQISDAIRDRLVDALDSNLQAIDLRMPRGQGRGLFTSRYARRNVATVGFDDGSRLVRVGARVYLARGATVEVVDGPSRMRPLETALARDVLARARRIRVTLPGASETLMVIATSSVSGSVPLVQAIGVKADGANLGQPRLVVTPGQGALVYAVNGNRDFEVELEITRGFRVIGVVGGPGSAEEWAERLASLDEWDLVEDGPLAPQGSTKLRLEVSK